MDFRQLEAFCAIVEWGSFSEAAKHLYITQPTISNHIRTLEASLHTRLLARTTKLVSLTEDGEQFYEYAKNLLSLREKTLREFNRTELKVIQFGVSSIPSAYILPEILASYRKKNDAITYDLVQSDSKGILDRILSGTLDMGITGVPIEDDHCICVPIYRDEMVLVTPNLPHYQQIKDNFHSLDQLLEEPFLVREDGSGTKKEADQFLLSLGMDSTSLNIVGRMNDLEAIKQSIVCGLGVSILSKRVTQDLEDLKRVLVFPLSPEGVYRNYYLIYRKSRIQNQQLWDFIKFIENYYL